MAAAPPEAPDAEAARPTLRACLRAPLAELRATAELPFAIADGLRLPPLPTPARGALRRGLGPGRRELTLAIVRVLARDTAVSRLLRRELGLRAAPLRELARRDAETVRLGRGARLLAERAGAARALLDAAMAGLCARVGEAAAELRRALRDPAERTRLASLLDEAPPAPAPRLGEAARHAERLRTLARQQKARLSVARDRLRRERAARRGAQRPGPGGLS